MANSEVVAVQNSDVRLQHDIQIRYQQIKKIPEYFCKTISGTVLLDRAHLRYVSVEYFMVKEITVFRLHVSCVEHTLSGHGYIKHNDCLNGVRMCKTPVEVMHEPVSGDSWRQLKMAQYRWVSNEDRRVRGKKKKEEMRQDRLEP